MNKTFVTACVLGLTILNHACSKPSARPKAESVLIPSTGDLGKTDNVLPSDPIKADPNQPLVMDPGSPAAMDAAKAADLKEEEEGLGTKILNGLGYITGYSPVQKCEGCEPKLAGDFVHRKSGYDSAYVGHAGIFTAEKTYLHVTTHGEDMEGALAIVDSDSFFSSAPGKIRDSWGAKRPKLKPDGLSADEYSKILGYSQEIMAVGTKYDLFHLNQKGRFYPQNAEDPIVLAPGYFKYDCVGYVEGVFENPTKGLGINLTPDDQESGLGIPLTVREQRDSPFVISVGS